MKAQLLLTLLAVLFLAAQPTNLFCAASNAVNIPTAQVAATVAPAKFQKKEKRTGRLKTWWAKQTNRLQNAWKWLQRISLGFVGFIVMLVGGLFIVLGIVIPVPIVNILFLVIGIIIAFVGLLLWLVLSRIGVRVSDGGPRRQSN